MIAFWTGFGCCYALTAALLVSFGWRKGGFPPDLREAAVDVGLALIWPAAFLGRAR